MGCPNFFRFHKNATVDDYAKRFGYDSGKLKTAIASSGFVEKYSSGSNSMVNALIEMDNRKMTKELYDRVDSQNYLKHAIQMEAPMFSHASDAAFSAAPLQYFNADPADKLSEYRQPAAEKMHTEEEKEYASVMDEGDDMKKNRGISRVRRKKSMKSAAAGKKAVRSRHGNMTGLLPKRIAVGIHATDNTGAAHSPEV